jgi:hypothetical protein
MMTTSSLQKAGVAALAAMLLLVAGLAAAPASHASSTQSTGEVVSGHTPCEDSYLEVESQASGSIIHFVDGVITGIFWSGSTPEVQVSNGASSVGDWTVDATGSIAWATGTCLGDGGGSPTPPEDPCDDPTQPCRD